MFESSLEGRNWSDPKKFPRSRKKVPLGLKEFAPIFGKLTTPYVMFEIKKTQILIEFLDRTQKKFQLAGKKSFLVGKKSFLAAKKSTARV